MGLLNDTKNQKKLYYILTQHYHKLITLSFITGVIWFCLLASDVFNNKTYFSENALLPGLVIREFNPRSSLSLRLDALVEEAKTGFPSAWIQGQFHQLGLDVYHNNFTVQYPFGSKNTFVNKNVYAVLRAPKVSSTEAIVISTPYRDNDSIYENNFASIALMIELAQAFRQQTYWSKDIIFLITQFENIGFQAWLDAYHDVHTSAHIIGEKIHSSSGLIQGVINLEISSYHFSHIDVKIEGLHGQLPNLDFFNLVIELCNREQIPTSFQGQFNYYLTKPFTLQNWNHNFLTMARMISLQATGLPTGGHGLFHRFGIQALTLKSVENKKSNLVSLIQLGRVVEGTVRSLNNLLEKFHQSFFFYLLPSTRTYVSIGLYIPPFTLIALPVLLKALQLYLNRKDPFAKKINYWSACNIFIVHLSFGLVMFFIPNYVDYIRDYIQLSTEDLLYSMLLVLMLFWLILTCFSPKVSKSEFEFKMCFVLLTLGLVMFTLALVNISFALLFTLLYVPISISLQYNGRASFLQYFYLLLIHPFTLSYIIVLIQSYGIDNRANWWTHCLRGFEGQKKVILFTIEDMYFFGNWNYKIVMLIILPLWYNLMSLKIFKVYQNK